MRRIFSFLLIINLSIALVHGQDSGKGITVTGILKDGESGETLPFATVQVLKSEVGTITNADGYFTLFSVPSDTSTLEARYIGYNVQHLKLDAAAVKQPVTIFLFPATTELSEIVITGRESTMMDMAGDMNQVSLSPAQISSLPGIGERDIFRTLQLLPGISSTNEASSGLFVRGGTPDQNLVLLDGFTIYHVDHFTAFLALSMLTPSRMCNCLRAVSMQNTEAEHRV